MDASLGPTAPPCFGCLSPSCPCEACHGAECYYADDSDTAETVPCERCVGAVEVEDEVDDYDATTAHDDDAALTRFEERAL